MMCGTRVSPSLEAAKRLGVTPQRLYEMRVSGEIDGGADVHGQVRFPQCRGRRPRGRSSPPRELLRHPLLDPK